MPREFWSGQQDSNLHQAFDFPRSDSDQTPYDAGDGGVKPRCDSGQRRTIRVGWSPAVARPLRCLYRPLHPGFFSALGPLYVRVSIVAIGLVLIGCTTQQPPELRGAFDANGNVAENSR